MSSTETFDSLRPLLFSIAYRMLGTAMDAEDIVQEAYIRWMGVDGEVDSPKAYLSAIVTRLSIDFLRSARVQRETYTGPWLPEPLLDTVAPPPASIPGVDRLMLNESLSMAFLVLLESLNPVERAAFLLREVFDYGYAEIAEIIEKDEANVRQIVSRARKRVDAGKPRFEAEPQDGERLVSKFVTAIRDGDLDSLLDILSDDITLWADGGGKAIASPVPVRTARKVGKYFIALNKAAANTGGDTVTRPAVINGQPGFLAYVDGQLQVAMVFEIVERRIHTIRVVLNPDKLANVPPSP